jgi:N,N'-diacetyllegionaminate synthase
VKGAQPVTKTVAVGTRSIGPGHPCFLAAEVGTTSLGDVERALRLVEAGAAAGMDAVKFQLIDPDQLSDASVSYSFRSGGRTYEANMQEMFRRLAFTEEEWGRIAEACRKVGVVFYATVDFVAGVDLLERLGVPVHKLGAWDGTFRPLIERIGATGKPMFADLGPTTSEEVGQLVDWYRGAGGSAVLFLHDFHTGEDREMNLRAVTSLAAMYEWPAGRRFCAIRRSV